MIGKTVGFFVLLFGKYLGALSIYFGFTLMLTKTPEFTPTIDNFIRSASKMSNGELGLLVSVCGACMLVLVAIYSQETA